MELILKEANEIIIKQKSEIDRARQNTDLK
jgi:hypothetical protein